MTGPGWDACHGSPRPTEGLRRLPDGSVVISNRAGEAVRVAARDIPRLVAMLSEGATSPDQCSEPGRVIDRGHHGA